MVFLLFAAAVLLVPRFAFAGPVTVTPTTVVLGANQTTALVTLTNEGDMPSRFEATLNAWTETPDGVTVLEANKDIIVFPQFITLQPKESKKVRIGTEIPPGAAERSYRLILQELPQINRDTGELQIQVLSKISMPIFLTPRGAQAKAVIDTPALQNGQLSFDVANAGTSRFIVRQVDVVGRGASGDSFTLKTPGWYVLAGGRRTYRVALNADDCRRTTQIEITATGEMGPAKATVPVSAAVCGDARESRFIKIEPAPAAPG